MKHLKTTLLLSYICIASFSAAVITPALPAIGHDFNISQATVSWIVSIFLIGYVVGQLVYGPIAKRLNALNALRIGLLINLVGILICLFGAWSQNYGVLLAGRLITALGAASGLACTFMLMHDLLGEHEFKQAMSHSIVSFTLGIGLAVLIGGVITQYLHWQVCFWVLLIHGGLMLALTWCFQVRQQVKQRLYPLFIIRDYLQVLRNWRLLIFSLVVGLMSAFSYGYSAAAPIYAHVQLHLSAGAYGYWNLINMIGMLGGGLLSAYCMKRFGAKNLLVIGCLGMLPCCLSLLLIAITHAASPWWFFITTMFAYLYGGFLFPAGSYFALRSITDKANGSSMMSFVNMLSAVLSVIIIGYLPLAMILSFALVLSGFLVIVVVLSFLSFKMS